MTVGTGSGRRNPALRMGFWNRSFTGQMVKKEPGNKCSGDSRWHGIAWQLLRLSLVMARHEAQVEGKH